MQGIFAEAETLVHESTYLAPEDREDFDHSTMFKAVETAKKANVRRLILNHFGVRYKDVDAIKRLARELSEENSMKTTGVFPDELFVE